MHLRFHFDGEHLSSSTHRKCCTLLCQHATREIRLKRTHTGTVPTLYLMTKVTGRHWRGVILFSLKFRLVYSLILYEETYRRESLCVCSSQRTLKAVINLNLKIHMNRNAAWPVLSPRSPFGLTFSTSYSQSFQVCSVSVSSCFCFIYYFYLTCWLWYSCSVSCTFKIMIRLE